MNLTIQTYQPKVNYNQSFKSSTAKAMKNAFIDNVAAKVTTVAAGTALAATVMASLHKAKEQQPYYNPENNFSYKSAKESAEVFEVNTFVKGSKEDILNIIDEKGVEYVTKLKKENNYNSLVMIALTNNTAEVIGSIIDKLGLDVILKKQKGYHTHAEMACMYNDNPDAVELLYDRIITEKGFEYITAKTEENRTWSLVDNTFTHNSADVIQRLIDKFGKELFLTSLENYATPVELACRYNKNPKAVWLMCEKFQGYDTYVKTDEYPGYGDERVYERNSEGKEIPVKDPILLTREDTGTAYIATKISEGKTVIIENPIFVYSNGRISPLVIAAHDNEAPDVIEYIYKQFDDDKDMQDIIAENVFEFNPTPEVIERLVDIMGKDEVTKRIQNAFGGIEYNYLDKAFMNNKNPEVIGMLIDKFGIEPLIKNNPKSQEISTLDRYFLHHVRIRNDEVDKKIVEKLGPIVIRKDSAYPLSQSKHPKLDKLFGKIISEDCFKD